MDKDGDGSMMIDDDQMRNVRKEEIGLLKTIFFFLYTSDTSFRAICSYPLMVVAGDGSDSLDQRFVAMEQRAHRGYIHYSVRTRARSSNRPLAVRGVSHDSLFSCPKQCPPAATITAPVAFNYAAN